MARKLPYCEIHKNNWHYTSMCPQNQKPIPVYKPLERSTKPIRKKGKRTLEYERWKKEVAIPYLDQTTGRVCQACFGERCGNQQLDVDHILNRGSHPALRMNLDNVQYLGRYPCHIEKTDGIKQIKDNHETP